MRIAQIAPTWISIPPVGYGGVEAIISFLTEELVKRGHEVTLFASGDSKTKARLFPVVDKAPGLSVESMQTFSNNMEYLFNMCMAIEKEKEFDLIHWHFGMDIAPIMLKSFTQTPSVVTIHNHFSPGYMKAIDNILEYYKDTKYFVSISDAHREHFPFEFIGTVYNGINVEDYDFNKTPQKYLVWLGRFIREKGADVAIQAALKLGLPIKLAAPEDSNEYFLKEVKPFLGEKNVEYVGEVDFKGKNELLKNAFALLSPISWDEPFGLVVPEANACGTPVVAYARGAMSEIIKEGMNGFTAQPDDFESLVSKIDQIVKMDEATYLKLRESCRSTALERFTIGKMVDGYEKVYQKIIEETNGKIIEG